MSDLVLQASDLTRHFSRKGHPDVVAVDGVSLAIELGECVGLVGGSGCGKSTIANMIVGLIEPTSGTLLVNGHDVAHARGAQRRRLAQDVQMVFQNPVASFDPRRTLGNGIAEGLRNFGMSSSQATERAADLLEQCGLPRDFANRYPREVSGGQCQRAAIARALALEPSLIICDEATSALDVTVQSHIVSLLREVQKATGAALLLICHDLALVQGFCDNVAVMQAGKIVEAGSAERVIAQPQHSYTRQLLDSVLNV